MRRTRFTKPFPLIAGLFSGLLFAILAVPLGAQPAPKPALLQHRQGSHTQWHRVERV